MIEAERRFFCFSDKLVERLSDKRGGIGTKFVREDVTRREDVSKFENHEPETSPETSDMIF